MEDQENGREMGKENMVIGLVFRHSKINGNKRCHSRESGNPASGPRGPLAQREKHWIPSYQVRGRLSQARNDELYKTYVVMYRQRGITLLELLVAMVICGILIAGIYRLFIAQSRAYTVQDQVAEVQQNIRNAMEILLRDLRMAGFDDDNINSTITITNPIVYPVQDDSITVNYEYFDKSIPQYQKHTVHYWRDASSRLMRQLTVNDGAGNPETLLEHVDALNLTYGVDGIVGLTETQDGAMDDRNGDGIIDDNDWISAATVNGGNLKVIAVRVTLTARPERVNPDLNQVSPRGLISAVTLRNLCLIR